MPDHVRHGTPNAYNYYRCRCPECVEWRSNYDADRQKKRDEEHLQSLDAAREYIREKGLRFYGPGPFRRNPYPLARLLATYLNDDLALYIRDYRRRNST